jgi:hypothetical protein
MVRRNASKINKQRKKQGKPALYERTANMDTFKGRNYIFPLILVMLTIFYVTSFGPWVQRAEADSSIFWITVILYLLLAVVYFFRRPYLSVTKDSLETRRFTGYKTLRPGDIRKIVFAPGYVIVEPAKGTNWVFSRYINLFPVAQMQERLKTYCEVNKVELEVRAK